MSVYTTLAGLRVAELRGRMGWTQEELAERAGLSRPTIQRVERGTRALKPGEAVKLAGLLGVRPEELRLDGGQG